MDSLEEMNYRDLQKLAKSLGVRANLPKAELLRALQDRQANRADTSASGLNSTFEVDPTDAKVAVAEDAANITDDINPDNSLLTDDGADEEEEKEKLDETFEVVGEEESGGAGKRRSTRLSVSGLTAASLAKETAHTPPPPPAPKPTATVSSRQIKVPSRRSVAAALTPSGVASSAVKQSRVAAVVERLTTPSAASKRKRAEENASNIPRFVKFSRKAPDFAKLHERQFEQMESLDSYMAKKRQRTQAVQEMDTLMEEHNKIVERCKSVATPRAPFVPAVTSVSKMNLNFGGTTNTSQQTFRFTAAPTKAPSSAVKKKKEERPRTDLKALTKNKTHSTPKLARPAATPARSAASATGALASKTPTDKVLLNITNKSLLGGGATPSSAAKKPAVFDLKASLAKPLGYKPHTGKLEEWGKKKVTEQRQMSTKEVMEKTRNILKGVRMNKRAALLLQNRKMD